MKETRLLMGMPITVEIVGNSKTINKIIGEVFDYFRYIDGKFSPYKSTSELSLINRGEIAEEKYSDDMRTVFALSRETQLLTGGYFDIIGRDGRYDPSGLVKGWAIYNAAEIIRKNDFEDFYVDAGGDIQVRGVNSQGEKWSVGIKNPFNQDEIVKVLHFGNNEGVATSGTYIRGQHIYNPKSKSEPIVDIVSLTVIGPNICEADRFATAAFAMGKNGINFIQNLDSFEGYLIDKDGIATMTRGFEQYTHAHD